MFGHEKYFTIFYFNFMSTFSKLLSAHVPEKLVINSPVLFFYKTERFGKLDLLALSNDWTKVDKPMLDELALIKDQGWQRKVG